jgi:hypothetical protein
MKLSTPKFYIFMLIVVAFLVYFLYQIINFSIFDYEPLLLKKIQVYNSETYINVYHLPSNASSEEYIQVKIERKKRKKA